MTITVDKNYKIVGTGMMEGTDYQYKIVDKLPEDFDMYDYKYYMGDFIKINIKEKFKVMTIKELKNNKLKELETYIQQVKETGVEYNGKWFKCDDECKNNITQSMLFIDSLLPLTWFTRNNEMGTVTFETKEEFMAFVSVLGTKLADIQKMYYLYKSMIESASSEEELNNIIFGE